MKELFSIGHFGIYLFGVTIAIGMLVGLFIALKESERKGLNKDKIMDFSIYTIIVSILGARIYYILAFDFKYYAENPSQIFALRSGGLSIQGGLIAGILFAIWYTRKKNISFFKVADAFAPAIAIGQAIGRIGCDVYGVAMKTVYPWGVKVNSQIVHPAQMYEMVLDLTLFTYLWRRRGKEKYNGQQFIHYIIGFSIVRATVEFFRTNPIVIAPFTIAHVTSLIIIIIALIAARFIKDRNIVEVNEEVKTPFYHYILIILIAVVGAGIYYYINRG